MKNNALKILTICALFLFYKYIAQLFTALISADLMTSYGYDGVRLAILASSYYYAYSFMQIIAGLITDVYFVKLPMLVACLLISLMILLFTHTSNFTVMCISRVFMGVGAAFATVVYMQCAVHYTNAKTFGLVSSFLGTATMLGAACGGAPVALLFNQVGWKAGLNLVAMAGVMLALLGYFSIKNKSTSNNPAMMADTLQNIKKVMMKRDNLLLLVYSGLTFSPVAILGGLWGAPFLMTKLHITAANASFLISMMFVGHAIGSPIWTLLAVRFKFRFSLMHASNVIAFLTILIIINYDFSYITALTLFFIFGFAVGCFMLSFDLCREINTLRVIGLAIAFVNSGEGIVSAFLEPFIGSILDNLKRGSTFTYENYQLALLILPACFMLSSLVLLLLKPKQQVANLHQSSVSTCVNNSLASV